MTFLNEVCNALRESGLALDDLIEMKEKSGRPQDTADVEVLRKLQ